MRILPRLFRCLLVLTLVLNGAGVRAALTAAPAPAPTMASCHEVKAAGPAVPESCCDGGQCDCACMHAPSLPMVAFLLTRLVPSSPTGITVAITPRAAFRGSPFRPPIFPVITAPSGRRIRPA